MVFWFVIVVISVFVMVAVYVYFNQKNMVFYPTRDIVVTPRDIGIEFDDVYIPSDDNVTIHGWFVPAGRTNDKAILFCHGNAGNISHRLETIEFLNGLGVSVLIFDYRGYGLSTGEPTEEGVYADARQCYDWLVNEKGFEQKDIIVFGRSLGGAVAIELASRTGCHSVVVESSFTNAADMARKIFPILPTGVLLKYRFDSLEKIATVGCPVMVIHSPEDDLIPYAMGEKLYERAAQPKRFVKIHGGHNDRDYINDPDYRLAFESLLNGEVSSGPK